MCFVTCVDLGDILTEISQTLKARRCSSVIEELTKIRQEFTLFPWIWKDFLKAWCKSRNHNKRTSLKCEGV